MKSTATICKLLFKLIIFRDIIINDENIRLWINLNVAIFWDGRSST